MSIATSFLTATVILVSVFSSVTLGQTDMFWSFCPLNSGATNSFAEKTFQVGETGSLYLYVAIEIDTGCSLDISSTESGVIAFTAAESFDFDITLTTNPDVALGVRWGDAFGPAQSVSSDLIVGLTTFTVVSGSGMVFENNGSGPFLDQGFDIAADAFFHSRIDFETIAPGEIEIEVAAGATGIVHNGQSISPTLAGARIIVEPDVLLGDLNLDGMVTLLDVPLFVNLLVTNSFQNEGDMNQDGDVNLLDVDLFVDAIQHP